MKRKALDRLLGNWVLVRVDREAVPPVPGLGVGHVAETSHGARPVRTDHEVIFDPQRGHAVTFEDLPPEKRAQREPFILIDQDDLIALLADGTVEEKKPA